MSAIILILLSYGLIFTGGYCLGSLNQIRKQLLMLNEIRTETTELFDRYKVWAHEAMAMLDRQAAK